MRYTFCRRADRDLKCYGLSHAEGLALLEKHADGILEPDLAPLPKRTRKAQAALAAPAPAPIGPTVTQVMWMAACGKVAV